MTPGIRPILVGAVLSFLWFIVLAPLVAAPFGPALSPTVIDRGTARIASCDRGVTTLWRMWRCEAEVDWAEAPAGHHRVQSPRELHGTVDVVARDRLSGGRASDVTDFGDRTVVVPADMPANTGVSVAQRTLISIVAMVVLWGGIGLFITHRPTDRKGDEPLTVPEEWSDPKD